jgi:DNA-binding CsgD family transcriptional regulator
MALRTGTHLRDIHRKLGISSRRQLRELAR